MTRFLVFRVTQESITDMNGGAPIEADEPEAAVEKAIRSDYEREPGEIQETDSMGSYAVVESGEMPHFTEVTE